MKHYLKALKQKNSLLFSVGIVMLLVLTLCLSGCSEKNEVQDQTNGADTIPNQSASAEEPSSILYVNHQLGFSMEMPLNWMGQVEVKEEYGLHHQNGGNCITFYHKPTHDNGEGGILFFIDCYPGEWSEDNPPVIAGHSVVVAQTEKDRILKQFPDCANSLFIKPTINAEAPNRIIKIRFCSFESAILWMKPLQMA